MVSVLNNTPSIKRTLLDWNDYNVGISKNTPPSTRPKRTSVQNAQNITNTVRSVFASADATCPKNTHKNYDAKTIKWTRWCSERQFMEYSLGSEGKLLLFLIEAAKQKGNRKIVDGAVQQLSGEGI
ncbi:hypothetical protein PybrP1_001659 [[Pythium] brassicae (nom. inval.)]|nr:hypothetical protein PybrP1_001659 [[Pythium] brassicae (nom. inval.)]